jgi:hypothetical protein
MFIYFDRSTTQEILVHASDGRGVLSSAIIRLEHIVSGSVVTLTKSNTSTNPGRYDRFLITAADIEDLPEGDLLWSIKAAPGGDIDPDITLDTGRARIRQTHTVTVPAHEKATAEVAIYERS